MMDEHKGRTNDYVLVMADIPYKKADIKMEWRNNEESKLIISEDLIILAMNIESKSNKNLIIGDKIYQVNNKIPTQKTIFQMFTPGDNNLKILRRAHTSPVTIERLKKTNVQKMDGFSYFLLTCTNSNLVQPEPFGFSLKLLKNKAHVVGIEENSIASEYFSLGDCLLDLDGVPIPYGKPDFLLKYCERFFETGKFTVVVERAVAPETLKVYNILFRLLLPFEHDVPMGADAASIGREAALMHRKVFKKLTPVSIMTKDKTKKEKSSSDPRIKISNKSVETFISSDVKEEYDLKPVERKMSYDDF